MKTRKTSPDGDPIAEVSSAGWPHTTKKHAGELLYLAPDGTEQITDLGDDTVAHVMNKFHESQADELKYELHYLRHRDGNDLYQLDYSWKTGENIVREAQGGPVTYTGSDETMVNAREHGKFILRPASK